MDSFHVPFMRFSPKDVKVGIIQKLLTGQKLVSFNGSSPTTAHDIDNVTVINGKYWQSQPIENSSFTVLLSQNYVRLSSFSLMSCVERQCVYNINVYGSNEGLEWEEICKIRKDKTYFFGNVRNAECKSNNFYKSFKFMHVGVNDQSQYLFPIHYIELFGDLYSSNPKLLLTCMKQGFRYLPTVFITSFLNIK